MHHGRGETDDADVDVRSPSGRCCAPGDLFIWAAPNAGNPQKVQRYAGDWAAALREMAALDAEMMLPGHGLPIFGADRVREALTDTAELLESLEAQTLALMNQGVTLDHVLHDVEMPEHLREQAVPAAGVRPPAVHRPQRLAALRRLVRRRARQPAAGAAAEQAREWVALAGGVAKVLAIARGSWPTPATCGWPATSSSTPCWPSRRRPRSTRCGREIYAARVAEQESSMARNILNHAALASRQGKRDLAGEY